MSADRDLAEAIYHAFTDMRATDEAMSLWRGMPHLYTRERFDALLPLLARYVIDRVLTLRLREAARTGPWDEQLEAQCECMREALRRLVDWSEAYPTDIFPEPDLNKVRELLMAGGITLDAVSAHCMRHVLDGVGKIAREAARTGPWEGEQRHLTPSEQQVMRRALRRSTRDVT